MATPYVPNADGYFLTPADRKLIQDFLNRFRGLRINTPPGSREDWDDLQAPELYVALTPYNGIPALVQATSGIDGSGDTPGSAQCSVYQIINGELIALPSGLTKTVYNYSTSAVAGSTWIQVNRDKPGIWWAVVASVSSSSNLFVRFHIEAAVPSTNSCFCSIKSIPHGMSISSIPGQTLAHIITVCDPVGCYFNEPSGQLLGRDGWAAYMDPQVPCACQPNSLYPQWEVFALCCPGATCG